MRKPKIPALLALSVLTIVCVSCSGGSDGRPPTIVAGNVRSATAAASASRAPGHLWRSVRAWWRSAAIAQVPGITVAIVNTNTAGTTDEQGFFRLEGNHFGPTVVQFAGSGADARLAVTLPAGGELDLIDVDLRGSEITVAAQRIHFEGPITGVDCQGNVLQVLSGEQVPFRVRLQPSTAIIDQDGASLRCVDLLPGRTADVQGTVNSSGDVVAVSLRLNPGPNAAPTPSTFEGSVSGLQCPASITVARTQGNVQVNIGSGTQILESNGDALQCGDLAGGDTVEVEGTENSFGVSASRIERVAAEPTPTPSPTP